MTAQPARTRLARVCCGLAIAASLATSACAAGQRAQTADQKPTLDGTEASVGQLDLRAIKIVAPSTGTSYPAGSSAQLSLAIVNSAATTDHLTSITSSSITGWGAYPSAAAAQLAQSPSASSSAVAPSSLSATTPAAPTTSTAPAGSPTTTGRKHRSSTSSSSSSSTSAATPAAAPTSTAAPAPTANRNIAIPANGLTAFGLPSGSMRLVLSGLTGRIFAGETVRLTFTFAHAGRTTVLVPVALTPNPPSSFVPEPKDPAASATG